jgi:hypothetical protein
MRAKVAEPRVPLHAARGGLRWKYREVSRK